MTRQPRMRDAGGQPADRIRRRRAHESSGLARAARAAGPGAGYRRAPADGGARAMAVVRSGTGRKARASSRDARRGPRPRDPGPRGPHDPAAGLDYTAGREPRAGAFGPVALAIVIVW